MGNWKNTLEKMVKGDKVFVFGIIVIALVTCFTWGFSYINEPIGDDVLTYYDGALTLYLDEFPNDIGERITNPIQVLCELKFVYLHWSGRMTGYAAAYFGKMLPKIIQALITAIIFSGNIFLTIRIAYKNTRDALRAPLLFGGGYIAIYWYRSGCFYEYMWTMVTIYSLPCLLILSYYNLCQDEFYKTTKTKVAFQWLGFLVGISHEVLSLLLLIIIGTEWSRDFVQKKSKFTDAFRHTGLLIGYLFCFFAPGNFYRTTQSHDAVTNTYSDRLKVVWDLHKSVIAGTEEQKIVFHIVSIFAFAVIIIMITRGEAIGKFLMERIGLITAICLSIFICAAMPHYPVYGEDMWVLLVYALYLSLAVKITEYVSISDVLKVAIPAAFILIFSVANIREVYSYSVTSHQRRELVEQAVADGADEVLVPRFNESLSADRYLMGYLNDQNQYDTDYYKGYYGTRLVIEPLE